MRSFDRRNGWVGEIVGKQRAQVCVLEDPVVPVGLSQYSQGEKRISYNRNWESVMLSVDVFRKGSDFFSFSKYSRDFSNSRYQITPEKSNSKKEYFCLVV